MFGILQGVKPMGSSASLANYLKNNTSQTWKYHQHSSHQTRLNSRDRPNSPLWPLVWIFYEKTKNISKCRQQNKDNFLLKNI